MPRVICWRAPVATGGGSVGCKVLLKHKSWVASQVHCEEYLLQLAMVSKPSQILGAYVVFGNVGMAVGALVGTKVAVGMRVGLQGTTSRTFSATIKTASYQL